MQIDDDGNDEVKNAFHLERGEKVPNFWAENFLLSLARACSLKALLHTYIFDQMDFFICPDSEVSCLMLLTIFIAAVQITFMTKL